MDALNGPVGQLGVPLAAAGLSAAFPRRGAPAVHAGLGALGAMQDYKTNNMRLQELTHQRDQRNDATQKFVQSLGDTSGEHTQGVSGNVPASDMSLKASTLDAGVTPRMHSTQMPPELANQLRLQAVVDPEGAMREATHFYASQGSAEAHREPLIHSNITNEYGDQIENVIDPNPGGSQRQFYMGGAPPPKPDTSLSETEFYQKDPEGYKKFKEAGRGPAGAEGAEKVQAQFFTGPDGASYWVDSRHPERGAQPIKPPAGPFDDVISSSSSTAPEAPSSAPAPRGKQPFSLTKPGSRGIVTESQAADIGEAIRRGEQPPTGLGANTGKVRAYLATQGDNLSQREMDFEATRKHLATLNGPQQTRLRQALDFTDHSLTNIENLYAQWEQKGFNTQFPLVNRAALAAAMQTDGEAGQIARALDQQLSDFTSEVGNVIMGGSSPTDHALTLAAKNLQKEWPKGQFGAAVANLRKTFNMRRNSLKAAHVAGASPNNPYAPQDEQPTAESGQATPAGGQGGSQYRYVSSSGKYGSNDGQNWVPIKQ